MDTPEGNMDATAAERQKRRTQRLKKAGITRTTVLVHEECRPALDSLKTHFSDPGKAAALNSMIDKLQSKSKPTNIAQVRHLSPFRYPGGKTWLVPEVRQWMKSAKNKPSLFIEPFAGGAITSLSMAAEGLTERVLLCELDSDVAAVWETLFHGTDAEADELARKIITFDVTLDNVREVLDSKPRLPKNKAFRTIIKNRMQRGGIMAAGAGLVKSGEDGKGLMSRWYPETLAKRINVLRSLKDKIDFEQGDAFDVVRRFANDPDAFFFVDPPYTAGGKKAGSRLYTHNEVDHEGLFALMASVKGSVMMTYDDAPEVREMANRHGFRIEPVPMKNTHHNIIYELLILKP